MSKKDEALKLALGALEAHADIGIKADKAITAIREALAEQPAQQEPVAVGSARCPRCWEPITPQPSKPWVGLTQQDIDIAFDDTQEGGGLNEFARAIEAKLKEKNNG